MNACFCPGEITSTQACRGDGKGWEVCQCGDTEAGSDADMDGDADGDGDTDADTDVHQAFDGTTIRCLEYEW